MILSASSSRKTPPGCASSRTPRHQARHAHDLHLATAMRLLVLLAALCLLLGIPVGAVIFGSAVMVLAYIRYRR